MVLRHPSALWFLGENCHLCVCLMPCRFALLHGLIDQAAVAAVNAYIGSQAIVSVSPELSLWTQFLAWVFGPTDKDVVTGRVCCPPAKCHSMRGGSHVFQVVGAKEHLHAGGGLAHTRTRCKLSD